jgi:hypothetical protein
MEAAVLNAKRRRRKPAPQQHSARLLRILEANLERVRDPALRARLERAIAALKERRAA